MLIRCLNDHQLAQNPDVKFTAGTVYDVDDEMGRRLLQDFGKNSAHVQRHNAQKFERVTVEGDTVQIVVEGETQNHAVTADEGYHGEAVKVTADGRMEGPVDHSHQSQSEPEQPPYSDEKLAHDGDTAEADHTTATQGGAGIGAPAGQVGSGTPGDTLSSDVNPAATPPPSDVPAEQATPSNT